ncbi:hypothetical protein TUM20249_07540 [Pseudomonas tohonis]|nr:hypothetical protein TUM20249_07540 [Pseudomonas tohonis]
MDREGTLFASSRRDQQTEQLQVSGCGWRRYWLRLFIDRHLRRRLYPGALISNPGRHDRADIEARWKRLTRMIKSGQGKIIECPVQLFIDGVGKEKPIYEALDILRILKAAISGAETERAETSKKLGEDNRHVHATHS